MYTPGPRFLLELRPFLKEMFGDKEITDCASCKDPVVKVDSTIVNIKRTHSFSFFFFFFFLFSFRDSCVETLGAVPSYTPIVHLAWHWEGLLASGWCPPLCANGMSPQGGSQMPSMRTVVGTRAPRCRDRATFGEYRW